MLNFRLFALLLWTAVLVACRSEENDPILPNPNLVTEVSVENRFESGEKIILSQEDAANIISIRRIVYPSSNKEIVSDEIAFAFEFKYRPQRIFYTLILPNKDAKTMVLKNGGVFEELTEVSTADGISTASVATSFSTTKSEDLMMRVALLDQSKFYSDYRFEKDPYGDNPLCARADFRLTANTTVELMVKGQNDNDIVVPFEHKAELSIPVLGLYKGDNQIYYTLRNGGIAFSKGQSVYCAVPYFNNVVADTKFAEGFRNQNDEIYVTSGTPKNADNNWGPSDPHDGRLLVGYDQWGKLRLVHPNKQWGATYMVKHEGQNLFVRTRADELTFELIDFSGRVVDVITYNEPSRRLHHDAANGPEGIIVIPYGYGSDECGIIEYNISTKTWSGDIDLRQVVSNTRRLTPDDLPDDPIHVNSIAYSKNDDCYVISCRHQGIVKIKRGTKELKWIITPHINLAPPESDIDLTSKVLTPTNFENVPENWVVGQHNAIILPNGDIACYDNHNTPIIAPIAADRYSRLVSFRVNEAMMSIEKLWSYNTPDKMFSWYMGGCQWIEDKQTIIGAWPVQQYSAEVKYGTQQLLWESRFKPYNTFGDIYRTYKIKLYE